MHSFTLPAGRGVRFTATVAPGSRSLHRWAVALFAPPAEVASARLSYGSRIRGGEDHTIEVPGQEVDCQWQVWASCQTATGWETDLVEVTADTPDNLSISFRSPAEVDTAVLATECVLDFRFASAPAT